MRFLAIETSSIACSVALSIGDEIIERHEEQPRQHTQLLLPMIRAALADSALELCDLDALVLGNGPGSFIGMRIATSVCQGLAFGGQLKVIPVSSMAAVAAEVFDGQDCEQVVVAQDAHMQEVYLGIYERCMGPGSVAVISESIQEIAELSQLGVSGASRRVAAGAGWQRYPNLIAANEKRVASVADVLYPRARWLLKLADIGAAVGADKIEPAYLRNKVAEVPTSASPP